MLLFSAIYQDNRDLGDSKMSKETKTIVAFGESFAKLDIRIGRVTEVVLETRTHKPTYKMVLDFGKFGNPQITEHIEH